MDALSNSMSMLNSSLQGLTNTVGGIAESNKQFERQKEAMALANDYNLNSMGIANDYNINMFHTQANFNREMWQRQIDQWNAENQYNSAASQVQRLREAGLNPSMAMGNAGMSGGSPSAMSASGSGVSPLGSSAGVPPLGQVNYNAAFDAAQQIATIRNIDANTAKVKVETSKTTADTNLVKAQTDYQNTLNKWSDLSEEQRIEQTKAAVQLALAGSDKSEAEKNQIIEQTSWIGKLNEAQIKDLAEAANLKFEQAISQAATRRNLDASAKAALSQVVLNDILGDKAASEAALNSITSDKVKEDVRAASHYADGAYYNAMKSKLEVDNLAHGVDTHASMAGFLGLFARSAVHDAKELKNSAVDSVKDGYKAVKKAYKSARSAYRSDFERRRRNQLDAARKANQFNAGMQY